MNYSILKVGFESTSGLREPQSPNFQPPNYTRTLRMSQRFESTQNILISTFSCSSLPTLFCSYQKVLIYVRVIHGMCFL